MNLRAMFLKLCCPVGEKERRDFRKEVHRMLATSEDMTRTLRRNHEAIRVGVHATDEQKDRGAWV